jgi:hypothetical protein
VTTTQASLTAFDNCTTTVDGCDPGGCAQYFNGEACSNNDTGPGSVCFAGASFEDLFLAVVPVFCK